MRTCPALGLYSLQASWARLGSLAVKGTQRTGLGFFQRRDSIKVAISDHEMLKNLFNFNSRHEFLYCWYILPMKPASGIPKRAIKDKKN